MNDKLSKFIKFCLTNFEIAIIESIRFLYNLRLFFN